ncbi:MAG: hypothetical protein ABI723_16625 [Bacteroidia bacterium]
MKQVTLQIPDKKYPFFMELIKSLDFVKKVRAKEEDREPTKEEILDGIKQAVNDVNLIKSGKLKAKPLNQFLDEL